MKPGIGSRSHLEDDDLVRYMDRQMDREEQRLARAHLFTCEPCMARLQARETESASVAGWLSALDQPPPPDRRAATLEAIQAARFRGYERTLWSGRTLLQTAAAVALLLTLAFGTPPGRAWVGGAVHALSGDEPGPLARRLLEMLGREPARLAQAPADTPSVAPPPAGARVASPKTVRPPRPQATAPAPGTSARVPFRPRANYVLIRFDTRQRAGTATVRVVREGDSWGQVVAGRRTETLEPMPDGLRVHNGLRSGADYVLEVPSVYRFIRVQIADEPETVIAVTQGKRDWLWTVSLAAGDTVSAAR